jgi:hypothetical protein
MYQHIPPFLHSQCLINFEEMGLNANCIFWRPKFFYLGVNIQPATKQTQKDKNMER